VYSGDDRESFDALSGRNLDAAIARHLLGFEVEPRTNKRTGEPDAVYRLPSGDWVRVSFYAERMGPSLEVSYRLSRLGWERRAGSNWNDPRVTLAHTDGRVVEAKGRTVSEALCRAALKAVEPH
jgi:hypothetical protein